eukprot:3030620-Rhodomonas_salina.3
MVGEECRVIASPVGARRWAVSGAGNVGGLRQLEIVCYLLGGVMWSRSSIERFPLQQQICRVLGQSSVLVPCAELRT